MFRECLGSCLKAFQFCLNDSDGYLQLFKSIPVFVEMCFKTFRMCLRRGPKLFGRCSTCINGCLMVFEPVLKAVRSAHRQKHLQNNFPTAFQTAVLNNLKELSNNFQTVKHLSELLANNVCIMLHKFSKTLENCPTQREALSNTIKHFHKAFNKTSKHLQNLLKPQCHYYTE